VLIDGAIPLIFFHFRVEKGLARFSSTSHRSYRAPFPAWCAIILLSHRSMSLLAVEGKPSISDFCGFSEANAPLGRQAVDMRPNILQEKWGAPAAGISSYWGNIVSGGHFSCFREGDGYSARSREKQIGSRLVERICPVGRTHSRGMLGHSGQGAISLLAGITLCHQFLLPENDFDQPAPP